MDDRMDQPTEPDNDEQQPRPDNSEQKQASEESFQAGENQDIPEENVYAEVQVEATLEPEVEKVPDKDDKLWAMLCHLSALASYLGVPFGNILGPLVIWLIKKDESAFVDVNGKKALNFQISLMIYGLAATPLICLGPVIFIVIIPLMIIGLIFPIVAAVKANNGEEYNYPISIQFIK